MDASEDSRPILQRLGFEAIITTTPWAWSPSPPGLIKPMTVSDSWIKPARPGRLLVRTDKTASRFFACIRLSVGSVRIQRLLAVLSVFQHQSHVFACRLQMGIEKTSLNTINHDLEPSLQLAP